MIITIKLNNISITIGNLNVIRFGSYSYHGKRGYWDFWLAHHSVSVIDLSQFTLSNPMHG